MNTNILRKAALAALVSMIGTFASAQTMVVREGATATPGTDLHIKYADSNKAGKTVLIEIYNGDNPTPQTYELHLDSTGSGVLVWTVPKAGWETVIIHAPDVPDVDVEIG